MRTGPGFGERLIFLGQTGRGKTTGMIAVLDRWYYGRRQIEVLDGKADPAWERLAVPRLTDLRQVVKRRWPQTPMVVWRPEAGDLADPTRLDVWCHWVYSRQHTVAVVDELTLLAPSPDPPLGYLSCVTRGRTRDITLLVGTQRPRRVPLITFSEATWVFCFGLSDQRDRYRVAEFTHPLLASEIPDPHGCWIWRTGATPQYYANIGLWLDRVR